ncbi:MAG TPA: hypothetical protein VF152_05225 [Acidimicrobiia bacterium]
MPGFDDRLEEALRGAAVLPDPEPDAVAAAVAVKRRRRRIRRRAVTGLAVATVVATALTTTVVVAGRDPGGDDVEIVADPTPPSSPPPTVTAPPPPPPATVPPEDVAAAEEAVPAAAPSEYAVEPGQVTVLASDEAMAPVTDTAGTRYEGVRFTKDDAGRWAMAPASACRLPGADPASCAALAPEVRVTPGKARFDQSAYGATAATVGPVVLSADEGFVRGPLVEANGQVWAAAYDRAGASYTVPPSRLVAFDPVSGRIVRQVDLQGEIVSLAGDGTSLWAVTHETSIDADRVEYRVKRIVDGATQPESMPLPPGAEPVGAIVAGPGGAWVPVRDGVIGFTTGQAGPTTRIALPEQERRGMVVVDDRVYTTAGTTIRRVDEADARDSSVLATVAAAPLTDLVVTEEFALALAGNGQLLWLDRELTTVEAVGALPPGITGVELHTAGDRVWATGRADLAPPTEPGAQSVAIEPVGVLVDGSGIAATLVIAGGDDAALAVLDDGALVLTSRGNVYHAAVPA